ncbi:hypothetical protein QBZ16_001103 [Prototheca wickerhamii]|uniref:Uncharacterized protein n=1 Tax=Prototheca wickerhamii TaxID=3111 RepID=A0AAD9MM05_PROWI|nr:hypothetical protein QBZ16_001103 [Prototheca wickerhamii]
MASADLKTTLKARGVQGFLDKSDGRDKLLAAVQYAAMFASAGQPGDIKRIQVSVATARKVFRILKPLESLNPIVQNPHLNPNKPVVLELLNKARALADERLKSVLMAIYFGGDNIVWASQAGILQNKVLTQRAQKASLYGWFGGSACTIINELYELNAMTERRAGESDDQYRERMAKTQAELNRHLLVFIHAVTQALLAMGLLELRPWKPRTVGLFGIVASVLNCYMLFPALPKPVAKTA